MLKLSPHIPPALNSYGTCIFRSSPPAGGQETVIMWVYALYNNFTRRIYIGQTKDLEKRVSEHNEKRGNHYTAKTAGKWIIIYKEEVANRKMAIIREKQLKSFKGREFIKGFIPFENES